MRVAADGFIDVSDGRKVRTPGLSEETNVDPMPEAEALSFLLSHSFPGHRRIVRSMTETERKRIRVAAWADSISERMGIVDRIWRAITEPVLLTKDPGGEYLVQIVQYGHWAYPVYLDGGATRVLPPGGVPVGEVRARKQEVLQLSRKTA
ncbi:MAG: hypothetical protein PVJ02_18495 [Gemmatimonadota bacterium]|jgi:hypothetical protein